MTDISDKRMKSAAAYLGWWITGILFLFVEKKDPEVRFHAMQSTVVFGAITLLYISFGIIPILGWIIGLILSPIIILVSFVLWILLMWKAFNGEKFKLPYFGDLAERQLAKLK